jgi:energy-coupling factor transporter ATP-binding protein EcfA2
MNKITIIHGDSETGKTTTAKALAGLYNTPNVVFLGYPSKNNIENHRFFFSGCNHNTELIVIDDIPDTIVLDSLIHFFSGEMEVNAQSKPPIKISPDIILVFDHSKNLEIFKKLGVSLRRRIHIVISASKILQSKQGLLI